jgi:hypothetical protein
VSESGFSGGIIWCYCEKRAVPYDQLDEFGKNVQYLEGLPENFGKGKGNRSHIILDDLLNQVYSKDVCDMRQSSPKY